MIDRKYYVMQSSQSANGFPAKHFELALCLSFVAYCNLFTLSLFGISIIVIVTTNALEVTEGWIIPAVHNLSLHTSCSTIYINIVDFIRFIILWLHFTIAPWNGKVQQCSDGYKVTVRVTSHKAHTAICIHTLPWYNHIAGYF